VKLISIRIRVHKHEKYIKYYKVCFTDGGEPEVVINTSGGGPFKSTPGAYVSRAM